MTLPEIPHPGDSRSLSEWLDGRRGLPPYREQEAHDQIRQRLNAIRRAAAGRDAQSILDGLEAMTMISYWTRMAHPDPASAEERSQALDRLIAKTAAAAMPVLRRWSTTEACAAVDARLDAWCEVAERPGAVARKLDRMTLADKAVARGTAIRPDEMRQLPLPLRRQAARHARLLASPVPHPGWVPSGSSLADEILWLENVPWLRHRIWRCAQVAMDMDTARLVLRHRQAHARHRGAASYAIAQQHGNAVSAERVMGLLHRTGRALTPTLREVWDTTGMPETIKRSPPWSIKTLEARLIEHAPADNPPGKTMQEAIPIERIPVIAADVIAAAGWTVHGVRQERHAVWRFEVQQPGIDRGVLLLQPFRGGATRGEGGYCMPLVSPWSARRQHRAPTTMLAVALNESAVGLSPDDLRFLAHEMGHALHSLCIPPTEPFGFDTFANDFVEVPSMLLERAITPERLASWSVGGVWRNPIAWQRAIDAESPAVTAALFLQKQHADALCDLLVHHAPPRSDLGDVVRRVHAAMGLPIGDHAEALLGNIVAATVPDAAQGYVYWWANSLVNSLVGPGRPTSDPARVYRHLTHHVLIRAVTPAALRTAWRAWRGQSLVSSAAAGAMAHVVHVQRDLRALLDGMKQDRHHAAARHPSTRRSCAP